MGIPDFTEAKYQELVDILQNGTCIFFGAGISKLAGYKLWIELKNNMVDFYWNNRGDLSFDHKLQFDFSVTQNMKEHTDIIEAFDYLYFLDKNLFDTGIKHIFSNDEKNEKIKIYHELSKLKNHNKFFITTNVDRGFEKYLGIGRDIPNVYPKFNLGQLPILTYLHGRIDDSTTWVFTRDQYDRAYINGTKPCAEFLEYIFNNYSVLFIGYGLMDIEIKQIISRTNKRKKHFWIEATSRNILGSLSIKSTTLRENHNIELITYSIDEDGHSTAIDIVNAIHKAVENR